MCILPAEKPVPTPTPHTFPIPTVAHPKPQPVQYLTPPLSLTFNPSSPLYNRLYPAQQAKCLLRSKVLEFALFHSGKQDDFEPESFLNSELDVPNAVRPFCIVQEPVLFLKTLGTRMGKVDLQRPSPFNSPPPTQSTPM